jgi:predicted alpha-1,2-mannosidase
LADALVKGIDNFDKETALKGVLQDALIKPPSFAPGRDGVDEYNRLGYVPYPEYRESSAKTLEYAYDDFCISQMATAMGKDSLAAVYREKAGNYRNVFDKNSLLMRGRKMDGSFLTSYSPLAWGGPFTEGNAWHYTWSVFHDPKGLIDLMGGEIPFINMLDSVFKIPPVYETGTYGFVIHEIAEMVAGNMGQYAHGNQPVQHMIYLYNYAGQPWKTQYWLREVMKRLYKPGPDGYCGDEDNGQTSAWYIFGALGFYPVCPGTDQYVFGSPLFSEVTMELEKGKQFIVRARNNSDVNRYIQTAFLNGLPYNRTWISHQDIMTGGVLEFEMGAMPSSTWGTDRTGRPFSMSDQ